MVEPSGALASANLQRSAITQLRAPPDIAAVGSWFTNRDVKFPAVRPNPSQDLVGGLVQVDERDSELAGAAARLFAVRVKPHVGAGQMCDRGPGERAASAEHT